VRKLKTMPPKFVLVKCCPARQLLPCLGWVAVGSPLKLQNHADPTIRTSARRLRPVAGSKYFALPMPVAADPAAEALGG